MQLTPQKKKGRLDEYRRQRAENMLLDEESLHQVWRCTRVSKPKLTEMRDELILEGRLKRTGRLISGNGKRFGK